MLSYEQIVGVAYYNVHYDFFFLFFSVIQSTIYILLIFIFSASICHWYIYKWSVTFLLCDFWVELKFYCAMFCFMQSWGSRHCGWVYGLFLSAVFINRNYMVPEYGHLLLLWTYEPSRMPSHPAWVFCKHSVSYHCIVMCQVSVIF
jgi:hypothetical protein